MKIISTSENEILYSCKITDVIIDHPADHIHTPMQTQHTNKKNTISMQICNTHKNLHIHPDPALQTLFILLNLLIYL